MRYAALDCVVRILDQLADENFLFAIQMACQKLDQAIEIEGHFGLGKAGSQIA